GGCVALRHALDLLRGVRSIGTANRRNLELEAFPGARRAGPLGRGVGWKSRMWDWQGLLSVLRVGGVAIVGVILVLLVPVLALVGLTLGGWVGALCFLLAVVLPLVGLLLLVRYVVSPDTVERYPDGRPKARGEHYHGDKQGPWTFWYPSGQVESRGEFVGGLASGAWGFWHPNGQMKARGEIGDDGLKRGPWQYWDVEGHALTEEEYQGRYPRSD